MRTAEPSPRRVRQIVRARLGRDPQDMLEAAVVLEAWAGMPAKHALESSRALLRSMRLAPQLSRSRLSRAPAQPGFGAEAIAFVVAVIAIAWWTSPLGVALGAASVERALVVALPATLALQWCLDSRYLSRPGGLAHLARRPLVLVVAAVTLVVGPWATIGASGAVAGLLAVTWTAGGLLIRRRWALAYAGIVIAATTAMILGLAAVAVLAATGALATLLVLMALRRLPTRPRDGPGRMSPMLAAGLIGTGLGIVLVIDPSVHWSVGTVPATALLPSTLASLWSGRHLWQVQRVIVGSLAGVPVGRADVAGLQRAPLRILGGAVGRLVLASAGLSIALLVGAHWLGVTTSGTTVLVGFGLVSLVSLLVSFLAAVGRARWALTAMASGIAGEALVGAHGTGVPGGGLIVAGTLAVLVALPVAVAVLSRPAATLATTLWIP